MSPRLERAALPKLLAHPAYRRHAKTEKFGNLASALASLVELENPPPHRDRNGSHGPTLSHNHVSVKLHHLWKCSKPSISSRVRITSPTIGLIRRSIPSATDGRTWMSRVLLRTPVAIMRTRFSKVKISGPTASSTRFSFFRA